VAHDEAQPDNPQTPYAHLPWLDQPTSGEGPLACPAAEVERRFIRRAPARHPGHVDHVFDAQLKATVEGGMDPLDLGGPVLEVDTSGPVDITAVARWVKHQPEWYMPMPSRRGQPN
jgi:hypothetical protein